MLIQRPLKVAQDWKLLYIILAGTGKLLYIILNETIPPVALVELLQLPSAVTAARSKIRTRGSKQSLKEADLPPHTYLRRKLHATRWASRHVT